MVYFVNMELSFIVFSFGLILKRNVIYTCIEKIFTPDYKLCVNQHF